LTPYEEYPSGVQVVAKKSNKNDELDEPSRDYWMEKREEHRKEE